MRSWLVRAVVALLLIGCNRGAMLSGRLDGLRDILEQADRNGAYNCAPRQFAVARSQLDFATTELEQGNASRAEEHLAVAEPNVHAAFRLSPAARCAPREVVRPEPVPEVDTDRDGILDSRDLCVLEPEDPDGYLDTDGCPEVDNDVDQIADTADRCASGPEDIDGYQDEDGCPDLDNDSDSVVDVDDRCPNEPGLVAEQGCPRVYQDVQVTRTHIRINQRIHFEYNRAVIRPESYGILNTVAQVLRDFPDISVAVEGHTDSQGSDSYNMRLSDQRANAVREYLIMQGIDPNRLVAHGYGETRPIESNRTNAGRAANRRVEFVRTDAGAQN